MKRKYLLFSLPLGAALLAIARVGSRFWNFSDFMTGFLEGVSFVFLIAGLYLSARFQIKNRKV